MSKLKYIVILTNLFCRVVASGTPHNHSFVFVNDLARVVIMTTMALGLAGQKIVLKWLNTKILCDIDHI